MTPEEIIDKFGEAQDLLVRFMQTEGRRRGHPFKGIVVDAGMRLGQARHLLRRFRHAELEHRNGHAEIHATSDVDVYAHREHMQELQDQIRLYGEAFYYFAWRARQALGALDGFDLAFDPIGVRNVRNRMIEHPEKSRGSIILSWMFDCPEGLILQPVDIDTPGLDPGLYPNATEFVTKLLAKLEPVVKASA